MSNEAKVLFGIAIATILIVVGGAFLLGNPSSDPKNPGKVDAKLLVKDDSYKSSSESAKVQLVEFADFQCPACAQYYPIVAQLKENYKKDLQVVFRHFPLLQHKNARLAAQTAEAAGTQGKFWEMHNTLFENQADWENHGNPIEVFASYAETLKLDGEQFKKAIEEKKFEDKIQRDVNDGNSAGVSSTPTFFLNGEKVSNVRSYDDFKKLIDTELQK